jgi:riboflavin biosynthesis pyrimidine reductase
VSLTRVFPTAEPVDDLDAAYAAPRSPWVRIGMITSVDGSVVGADGTSGTLTRGSDRKILGAIRRASDAVLIGAASLRREGYLLPKSRPLAVVTASGDLSGHSLPRDLEPGRLYVLCPSSEISSVDVPGARVIGMDANGGSSSQEIIDVLAGLGFHSIVCEGGPILAAALLSEGVVDELCLSASPLIGGPSVPALPGASGQKLDLTQLLVDDAGVSYARWIVARPATG